MANENSPSLPPIDRKGGIAFGLSEHVDKSYRQPSAEVDLTNYPTPKAPETPAKLESFPQTAVIKKTVGIGGPATETIFQPLKQETITAPGLTVGDFLGIPQKEQHSTQLIIRNAIPQIDGSFKSSAHDYFANGMLEHRETENPFLTLPANLTIGSLIEWESSDGLKAIAQIVNSQEIKPSDQVQPDSAYVKVLTPDEYVKLKQDRATFKLDPQRNLVYKQKAEA